MEREVTGQNSRRSDRVPWSAVRHVPRSLDARTNLLSIWRHLPYDMIMGFSGRARWRMLILLAAIFVVAVVAIVGWRTAKSYAGEMDLSSEDVPATASCLTSLLTDNTRAEIGDMVYLNDVKLKPGPQAHLFIAIGANGGHLLVRWEAQEQAGQPPPKLVDIKGIIRKMPTPRSLHSEWMLSKKESEILGRQSVYIAADSIKAEN